MNTDLPIITKHALKRYKQRSGIKGKVNNQQIKKKIKKMVVNGEQIELPLETQIKDIIQHGCLGKYLNYCNKWIIVIRNNHIVTIICCNKKKPNKINKPKKQLKEDWKHKRNNR